MRDEVELYYNEKQIQHLDMLGNEPGMIKTFLGGRGSGKTRCIPEDIKDRAANLPKGRIFLLSWSFDMIAKNVMPELREVFSLHGLKEGIHFVVDKKPPPHFDLPYKRLENPEHSISFVNGFAVQFLTVARKAERNRGPSYDGGIIDEALLITQYQFDSIIYPTVRGYDFWGGNPYFKMVSIYSSQPRTASGRWFLRYKALAEKFPGKYGFTEATAFDNLEVLGEDYVSNQKAVLGYADFQIEIMNKGSVSNIPESFYHKYYRDKHNYTAAHIDVDCNKHTGLELSFDFGGRYSCFTLSQENNGTEYILQEYDTNQIAEHDRQAGKIKKLPDIVQDFIKDFKGHGHKHVKIWGDRQGLDRNPTDDRNYYEQIRDWLTAAGWEVELMVNYTHSALHKSRWSFMNSVFEENIDDYPRVRINAARCPNLVISIETTRVTDDFKKDKKDERNQEFNQSHAPHLTDTLDYKLFNKYFYLLDDSDASAAIESGIDAV